MKAYYHSCTDADLRRMAARYERLLREFYGMYGPRGDGSELVTPKVFAKMTRQQVDQKWDFPERHRMHRVAKALSS